MNFILKNLLDNAQNRKENTSSPPFLMKIRAEKQCRPLPDDLMEEQDIPYGDKAHALSADVVYPAGREGGMLPVAVFVHGGALVTGDRKSNRVFCQELARRGFVVYSVEYRLIDRASAFGMVSDLCAALAMVRDTAGHYGGDAGRMSICAESAGAFLAIYAVAAGKSAALRRMLSCRKYGLSITHLVLISGMIYTFSKDTVGLVYGKELYGEKRRDRAFMAHIAPDNPRLISLLPPIFLVSSKADFLRRQTLKYEKILRKNRHAHKILYFSKGKGLTHAFPSLLPSLRISGEVIDAISKWMKIG